MGKLPSKAHNPTTRRGAEVAPRRSIIALLVLALYLLVLVGLTMLPHPRQSVQRVNLIPLTSILMGIRRGGWLFNVNVLGNIAAFAPLGLLVPLVSRRLTVPTAVLCSSLAISASIEIAQWLFARRVADVDDIILNMVGAFVGYGCYVLFAQPKRLSAGDPDQLQQ